MFSLNDLFKLADNDCTEAMVTLGSYFYNGTNGVSADKRKAFELLKKAADLYDPNAQMLVSEFYLKGIEVGKDVGRFEEYSINSINQNNLLAKCRLAAHYESVKNYGKAAELLADQRLQNSTFSTLHLSVDRYRAGDLEGAFRALDKFYKTETKQTILRAYCLFKGEGTKANPDDAVKILNKIKEDSPEIGYLLGKYEGSLTNSMLKDHKEASLMHMEESAAMNFPPAIYEAGIRYRDGIGIEANVDKGKQFIARASYMGYKGDVEYNPFFDDKYLSSEAMDFSNVIDETGKECLAVLNKRASTINPKLSETEKIIYASIGTAAANIIYGNKH